MPSQFQAVIEVFDNHQVKNPSAKSPLINQHEARLSGIVSRFGQRTCDTADGIERNIDFALKQGNKAVHCMKEAVEDMAESLLSAALQAGDALAIKFQQLMNNGKDKLDQLIASSQGKLEQWKQELEGWAKETFGGEYARMQQFFEEKVKPKITAVSAWLKEKKKEANDQLIETLEHLQACYNSVLDKVDALAYGAGDMVGVMRKAVCGLSGEVASMTNHGLGMLGYKQQENVKVSITNLRNDTRCLRMASTLNNIQASVVAAVPPAPLPMDVPGAAVANNINSHAQRAIVEVQVAANRFTKGHNMKLEASVQDQAANIIHGTPGAEGGTPVMPQLTPEKEARIQLQVQAMVSKATRLPVDIFIEMTDTWILPPKEHRQRPVHHKRTLTPVSNKEVPPGCKAGSGPDTTLPIQQDFQGLADKWNQRDPVEQPATAPPAGNMSGLSSDQQEYFSPGNKEQQLATREEVERQLNTYYQNAAPTTTSPASAGLPVLPEVPEEERSSPVPTLDLSRSRPTLPEVLYDSPQ